MSKDILELNQKITEKYAEKIKKLDASEIEAKFGASFKLLSLTKDAKELCYAYEAAKMRPISTDGSIVPLSTLPVELLPAIGQYLSTCEQITAELQAEVEADLKKSVTKGKKTAQPDYDYDWAEKSEHDSDEEAEHDWDEEAECDWDEECEEESEEECEEESEQECDEESEPDWDEDLDNDYDYDRQSAYSYGF